MNERRRRGRYPKKRDGTYRTKALPRIRDRYIDDDDPERLREKESVYNVIGVLAVMPEVQMVTPVDRFSHDDHKGVDLRVLMDSRKPGVEVEAVRVQVKSSQFSVEDFRCQIMERNAIDRNGLETWLAKNRLIILNGQTGHEKIEQTFWERYQEICRLRDA